MGTLTCDVLFLFRYKNKNVFDKTHEKELLSYPNTNASDL